MHNLEKKIREAAREGRKALVPFVTAGFPGLDTFWEVLEELDQSGADIIEIGIPFSDPVADGPVVEAASVQALALGVTLDWVLEGLEKRKGRFQAGIVLMGYYNPFLQFGLERFAKRAAACGVHGCIVPDLPLEEGETFRAVLREQGLALIPLVGPNTTLERMRAYADVAEGYVYVVSVLGTTGERSNLPEAVPRTLSRARQAFSTPIALGFGLREPSQLEVFPDEAQPDAVVFGSALIRHLESGSRPAAFLKPWR